MTIWTDPSVAAVSANAGWAIFNKPTVDGLKGSDSNVALAGSVSSQALLALMAYQGSNALINGGFEATTLSGWKAEGTAATLRVGSGAAEGANILRLGAADKSGTVAQTVSTKVGETYTLVFSASSSSVALQDLQVDLTAVSGTSRKQIEARTFGIAGSELKTFSFTFIALSSTTELKLIAKGGRGPLNIDDVRLVNVGQSTYNLVENGDFTQGGQGPNQAEGWTVETAAGVAVDASRSASENHFLALGGWSNNGGAVSQTISTQAGAVYTLTFGVHSSKVAQTLLLSIFADRNTGDSLILSEKTAVDGTLRLNYTFTALSSWTKLRFANTDSIGDLDLDDVRVVRVTEPSSRLTNGDAETSQEEAAAAENGWALDQSNLVTNSALASSGSSYIDLGQFTNGSGSAGQGVSTRAGTIYTFTFSARAVSVGQSLTLQIDSANADWSVTSNIFKKLVTVSTGDYKTYSITFAARSDQTVLSLVTAASSGDLLIDDTSLFRVAGKQDKFSDEAQELDSDSYIAGSITRVTAAMKDLGNGFGDAALRHWWALEHFDEGTDTNKRLFDEESYLATYADVGNSWSGSAVEHYLTIGFKEGRRLFTASLDAINLNADAFIASSSSLIAAAKRELGTKFNDIGQRGIWARARFDAEKRTAADTDLFDGETYLRLHPELASSEYWSARPEEYYLLNGSGTIAPLMSMGASTIDPDHFLAGSPDLIRLALSKLGAQGFADDDRRAAWTLEYFVRQGYKENRLVFDDRKFAAAAGTDFKGLSQATFYLLSFADAAGSQSTVTPYGRPWAPNPPSYDGWSDDNNTSTAFGRIYTLGLFSIRVDWQDHIDHGRVFSIDVMENWFRGAIYEFLDAFKKQNFADDFKKTYGHAQEVDLVRASVTQVYEKYGSPDQAKENFWNGVTPAVNEAIRKLMPAFFVYVPAALKAVDRFATFATTTETLRLAKANDVKTIEAAQFVLNLSGGASADYRSISDQFDRNLNAAYAFLSYKSIGAQLVKGQPAINAALAGKLLGGKTNTEEIATVTLTFLGFKKGSPGYSEKLKTVTQQIEAWGNRWNLVILRLLKSAKEAKDIASLQKVFSVAVQANALTLIGRSIPAGTMIALTLTTLSLNAASGYTKASVAGKLRSVASLLYATGSLYRVYGYYKEYADLQKVLQALNVAADASQRAAAALIIRRVSSEGGGEFAETAITTIGTTLRRASFSEDAVNAAQIQLRTYNETVRKLTKSVLGKFMAGVFAAADIVIAATQVINALEKSKQGKTAVANWLSAAATFNFAAGILGLTALFLAGPTAAALTGGVLVLSIIGAIAGTVATVLDGE